MRVIITGATGFIGRALCKEIHKDYEIIALTRNKRKAILALGKQARVIQSDEKLNEKLIGFIEGAYAIIHLAGENIAAGRWTNAKMKRILDSRTELLQALLEATKKAENKPKTVLIGSAVGYYGSQGDKELDENCLAGQSFLASVCKQCEDFLPQFSQLGIRSAALRSGVVLESKAGALPKFIKPFLYGMGGYIGSGKQWISWISLYDEVSAIKFLLEKENLSGPFNLTAPQPIQAKDFADSLGKALNKRSWTSMPSFAAKSIFGKMADEVLLASQKAMPKRLLENGFEFKHPDLEKAFANIFFTKRRAHGLS
jgi:hypothetical protein